MEKNRLAEALKKHQMLVEYNFYIPKGMDEQDVPPPTGGDPATADPAAAAPPTDPTLTPPADPTGAPATPEATQPKEDDMKLDDNEALAIIAAILGAILGTTIGALLMIILGFWWR